MEESSGARARKRNYQESSQSGADVASSSVNIKKNKNKKQKTKTKSKSQGIKQLQKTCGIVQFYSRSKDVDDLGVGGGNWRKCLSNFFPSEIKVDLDGTGRLRHFPTVEHAFHASKCLTSNKPEMADALEVGGTVGPDPVNAKRAGSKKGFEKHGATLNFRKWNAIRDECMRKALVARLQSDDLFKAILLETKRQGLTLMHFERTKNAYWGAKLKQEQTREAVETATIIGRNRLGELLMELRDGLDV